MTSRQTNNLLAGAAVLIGIVALAIVAGGVLLAIDLPGEEAVSHGRPTIEATPASQPAGLDHLFARSFRTALDDAPTGKNAKPVAVAAVAPIVAPIQINIVGTIGSAVALLRLADGSVVARSAGDQIDGAEIVRIDATSVSFRRNGQEFSVAKPPTADPSAGLIVIR